MAKRTIENCTILKRNINSRNEEMINESINEKCGGIKHYDDENDVIEPCKHCKLCISFMGYDDLRFKKYK